MIRVSPAVATSEKPQVERFEAFCIWGIPEATGIVTRNWKFRTARLMYFRAKFQTGNGVIFVKNDHTSNLGNVDMFIILYNRETT